MLFPGEHALVIQLQIGDPQLEVLQRILLAQQATIQFGLGQMYLMLCIR